MEQTAMAVASQIARRFRGAASSCRATAAGNATRLCLMNRLRENRAADAHNQRVRSGWQTKQYNPARLTATPNRCISLKPTRPGSKAHSQIDRKSTRLNSSHLGVSYAV